MKRIGSIDTIRGICMWIMIFGHILEWWINSESYWFKLLMFGVLESIGTLGFLFVSGVSAGLAYKMNIKRVRLKEFDMFTVRNIYFLRAFIILFIGFLYNIIVTLIWGGNITDIWSWLVLQTIGFSLILSWPLLKTSKYLRITLGLVMIFANQILLGLLSPYEGQFNILGITFHLLFNPKTQYVILTYLGIFLLGTVLGESLFDINGVEDEIKRKHLFKNKIIIKLLIIGSSLLIFGIIFEYPSFLIYGTLSSIAYAFGLILVTLSIFMVFEIFRIFKTTKSYKFLYYYSYYSFTIYLAHNILYFILPVKLNYIQILMVWVIGTGLVGILFRIMYHKLGAKASLKAAIGEISYRLAKKFQKKDYLNPIETKKFIIDKDN